MVLNFSNFGQLKKNGWEIVWGDKNEAEKKYNNCLEKNNVIIGVIGNKNRGKSFLLGRIIIFWVIFPTFIAKKFEKKNKELVKIIQK